MSKVRNILTSRLFLIVVLFALQLALIAYIVFWSSLNKGLYVFFTVLSIIIAIVIITRNEKAPYKLIWMFMLVVFPFFGGVFYILFAHKKIGIHGRKKLNKYLKDVERLEYKLPDNADEELYEKSSTFRREAGYIIKSTGFHVWKNTQCRYFGYGIDFFTDLVSELKKAERFIFIEYFIIDDGVWWNKILEILREKVKSGVDVRVIYDDFGSINSLPLSYPKKLRSFGIRTIVFNKVRLHANPRLNFRDHRKILSIDGNICYTGGLNLADEYANEKVRFGYWKDDAIKLEGSAVWNLTEMFLILWGGLTGVVDDFNKFTPRIKAESDGFVQPFGDNPIDNQTITENAFIQMINNAKKYIWIISPYLIPDDATKEALIVAAQSGIDVKIITPHYADKKSVFEVTRSNYFDLIKAGVQIYEFYPGFIHSKTFICDDEVCCLGTTNIDYRSFYLHYELSVMFYYSSIIKDVKEDFIHTLNLSKKQSLEELKSLPWYTKLLQTVFKIFSPAL